MRCGRCGNENSDGNRFCGMCGTGLVAKAPTPAPSVPPAANAGEKSRTEPVSQVPRLPGRLGLEAARVAATPPVIPPIMNAPNDTASGREPSAAIPPASSAPVISGPSFLGLNKPAEGSRAAYSNSRSGQDQLGRSSRNLDYLLENEEEPKRSWGKLVVVVIALALAGGFGYLRWKQGGFDWLKAGEKKPAATTQVQESAQSVPDSVNPAPAAATPSGGATSDTATSGAATPPTASGTAASATDSPAAQASPSQTAAAPDTTPQGAVPQSNPNPGSSPTVDTSAQAVDSDSGSQSIAAETPVAPKVRARKPNPVTPVDATAEAERYIYGRGVHQDCDHGLRLLKPAAGQSNSKAMIALGTLYSIGTCTPRDLPTAYRWFALALHKQPDNQPLQDDLKKLWSQMTQPERQLAIKLSQ